MQNTVKLLKSQLGLCVQQREEIWEKANHRERGGGDKKKRVENLTDIPDVYHHTADWHQNDTIGYCEPLFTSAAGWTKQLYRLMVP